MQDIPNIIISRGLQRKDRIPRGQKPVGEWPVAQQWSIPELKPDDWHLKISGLVARPMQMGLKEIEALPKKVTLLADAHCVDRWSVLNNRWTGVATSVIKDLADVLPEAKFVMVSSADGFTTNLNVEDFFAFDTILATHHNDLVLSPEHGYPIRLVVSGLYFWKSAKWVTAIEFTGHDTPGFWESRGYHNHGDPWLEERFA